MSTSGFAIDELAREMQRATVAAKELYAKMYTLNNMVELKRQQSRRDVEQKRKQLRRGRQ